MGTFYADCVVENHVHRKKIAKIPKLLVDTGSEYTWIPEMELQAIGVTPEKKDVAFIMANGQTLTRNIGFVVIRVGEYHTIDEVVFAIKGDLTILGAHTLEGLNLVVHPRLKKLVAAGPILAA